MKKQIFEYPKDDKELINKFLIFKDSSGGLNYSDLLFFFGYNLIYSLRKKKILTLEGWKPGDKFDESGWDVYLL